MLGGTTDPANEFALTVSEVRQDGEVRTETFDDLSMISSAPNFVERVVATQSRLVQVTVKSQGSDARGTSTSGSSPANKLEGEEPGFDIQINGDLSPVCHAP